MMRYLVIVLLAAGVISCSDKKETLFSLMPPDRTGIDFVNLIEENDTFNILKNEYMYNGGGVAVADFNKDGLSDLVFTGNKVRSRIYLNKGDFNFEDITPESLTNEQWVSGATIFDINGDALPDIYLTCTTSKNPELRKNRLWINQGLNGEGVPTFKEQSEQYGIADQGHSVHAAFLDYDLDGDLDLYVMNNTVNKDVPTNYRPKMIDGSSLNNDTFYENNGDGTFSDKTIEAGIVIEGFGLGLAVSDLNKDGYPDLYVSNDYISNDLMYINQKNKTFRNASEQYLTYQSKFSMGNDVTDVNQDGNPDIITLDMLPREYQRKKQTIAGNSYMFYINDAKYGYQHQYVRNMLQLHNGFLQDDMIPFSEVGQMAGIFDTEWSWSPLFADYDNDGDRDLLITNGFPKDLTDKDFTNFKAQMYNYLATEEQVLKRIPEVKVPNFAFERTDDLRFSDVTSDWGMDIPSYSNGAAYVDLDNDGDLDYVVNNIDDPAFVYRNNTSDREGAGNYLRVQLSGEGQNQQAIGAKVTLWADGQAQYWEQYPVKGYISSVDPILHFGLGETQPDSLIVVWPGDKVYTVLKDIQPNQLIQADQATAVKKPYKPSRGSEPALFESAPLFEYTHSQEDYIDFFDNQNVMPHKFSQIGPCMAQGDLNNDGLDDLLIGASDKLPSVAFLRTANGFEKASFPGLTDNKECTEADLVIMDVDGDGDNDVVAVSGGYRNQYQDEYKHYWYKNDNGKFTKQPMPLPAFPGSVVRPFDFDQDGDLDLFIGSRVKRDFFPYADPSYVVINNGGTFEVREELTFDLGMVTDAVSSDIDGDGWTDLLLAREWNSMVILKNEQGKSLRQEEQESLQKKSGMWSALVAGDLDGDGDDDYIAGNLGQNHRYIVNEEYPMRTYALDIDRNGTIDPIVTSYWRDASGNMNEYPVNGLDELASQSPFFRKRFTSYTQFSMATMDSIVDKASLNKESIFEVNTTSSYILWNENGQLTFEELPDHLQTSPVRKMLIRDLNDDGYNDVVITGNDYSYDVSTGYYDANKGFILLGGPERSFRLLHPRESGMVINGQVDGLLYYEGDTSYLIAGVNRSDMKVFVHKK